MFERVTNAVVVGLGIFLCFFTLAEVNYNFLQPQSALAVFVGAGLALCFLTYPLHAILKDTNLGRGIDYVFAIGALACCAYVVVQTEPVSEDYWLAGQSGVDDPDAVGKSLANRAGDETPTDFWIGLIGLVLVIEATRRAIGLVVPLLALAFIGHAYYCHGAMEYGWPSLPSWMLPHQGQNVERIVATTFLQTLGVFGPAAGVMFKYVFLFVVFGSFLEMSGATQFIIDFAERVFGKSPGGPAKVAVLGSGLMGSLSGSAVANAVTTGAFTIPMMRNAGFKPHIAAGITAAAASGGALVPPVMGAGAYMMLELVQPQVTFLQVAKAALIPAVLYYLSIFMIVHFYSRRIGVTSTAPAEDKPLFEFEGIVFFGALTALVGLLVWGFSPFKAVTGALVTILLLATVRRKLQIGMTPRVLALASFALATLGYYFQYNEYPVPDPNARQIFEAWLYSSIIGMFGLLIFGLVHPAWRPEMLKALVKSAKNGISLVAASACVGIIIGIVQETGIATDFSAEIKKVVQSNLLVALLGIMACSIVLGMGVPSVVCYLLMATLMGSLLDELGVIPLAAHLFIFYFGMMSMVTPPVALAAYASASIAQAPIMKTAIAAFLFSLVGFTLPYMFIYRPELLMLSNKPEIVNLSFREMQDGAPPRIGAALTHNGEPVSDTRIHLNRIDGDETVEATTDYQGMFHQQMRSGSWRVVVELGDTSGEGASEPEKIALGILDIDPTRITQSDGPVNKPGDVEQKVDERALFIDQRLSYTQVVTSSIAAALGIIALAAGIARYFFVPMSLLCRLLAFASAALLLFPDKGFLLGGINFSITDLAGLALLIVVCVLNKIAARAIPAVATT
ncbi:MAG: TRAP transporter fused permease subunit [Planctomycetota bacterium]|nr:TRAP transporter fused permease subunit [Planctomycetota bacterium]